MRSRMPLAVCLAFFLFASCRADAQTGTRVVSVSDGDTIVVRSRAEGERKVRLAAIDAPERDQASGRLSQRSLTSLLLDRNVRVEKKYIDRYGRVVAKVYVEGLDAGLEQVRRGFAWHYTMHSREQTAADRQAYRSAELDARRSRRGLWSDPSPVAPWEFRKERRATRPAMAAPVNAAVVGNRRTRLYHLPHCPGYRDTSASNRVTFGSAAEAEKAGFRRARNCS